MAGSASLSVKSLVGWVVAIFGPQSEVVLTPVNNIANNLCSYYRDSWLVNKFWCLCCMLYKLRFMQIYINFLYRLIKPHNMITWLHTFWVYEKTLSDRLVICCLNSLFRCGIFYASKYSVKRTFTPKPSIHRASLKSTLMPMVSQLATNICSKE